MARGLRTTAVADVAACTAAAVHRRDHHHGVGRGCHPHTVEVVHLGASAVTVCHDCGTDTGFLPQRQAELIASGHRNETEVTSVPLPRPPMR